MHHNLKQDKITFIYYAFVNIGNKFRYTSVNSKIFKREFENTCLRISNYFYEEFKCL